MAWRVAFLRSAHLTSSSSDGGTMSLEPYHAVGCHCEMTTPASTTLQQLRESIAELPERVRTGARVARQSGMLYTWTLPGIRKAVTALATGARNPAMVFSLHAANSPDKPALLCRDTVLTF